MKLHTQSLFPLLCVLAAIVLIGCGRNAPCVIGSGTLINESREVGAFHNVSFSGRGNLHLSQGNADVRISAEDNIMPYVQTRVEDGVLIINFNKTCIQPRKPLDIYISSPDFEGVAASGFADITGDSTLIAESLEIALNGAGKANLTVDAKRLSTRISGTGNVEYAGAAQEHNITISGSGDIHALRLATQSTGIMISGTGKADVDASSALDVTINGNGDISYTGTPQMTQEISGRGTIKRLSTSG
jgi:hypothetical protein